MNRPLVRIAISIALLTGAATAFCQWIEHGTPAQAKAMLLKAVAAVKADKTKALSMFNTGQGGFLDNDLSVFCANVTDGKVVAQGNSNQSRQLGQDGRTLKDETGKPFGLELLAAGRKPEGQITKVSYVSSRPGTDIQPAQEVSYATRVGDLICAVGYYR